jgi:hypothetical protein
MKSFIALLLLTGMALAQDTATAAAPTTKPEIAQALRGAVLLRDRMRDPDSFKIERALTRTEKNGIEVTCFEYRSRNGYGGMTREAARYSERKDKPRLEINDQTQPHPILSCIDNKHYPYTDITNEFLAAAK